MTQHINYVRRVDVRRRLNLSTFMRTNDRTGSFAVFGGSPEERQTAALRGIARGCGEMGVVILHNDTGLEERLGELYSYKPSGYTVFSANPNGSRDYDPLYGMQKADVLDSIVPFDAAGAAAPGLAMARSGLSDYLRIMEYFHSTGAEGFGQYPYNLDLLLSLVSMSYMDLESRVISCMPEHDQYELKHRMSAAGVQQAVWNMVENYAIRMEAYLWTRRADWQQHTRCSIASAVMEGNVISVRVPESNPDLLRCCAAEVDSLIRRSVPLLVVCCGLRVAGNPVLENIFFNAHNNWITGLVAPTLNAAAGTDRLGDILRLNQQVVVFPCASTEEAEAFSAALGSYYRLIHPRTRGRNRRFPWILPEFTRQVGYQETEVRNVRPEELMRGYVLLTGEDTEVPILVRHLVFD